MPTPRHHRRTLPLACLLLAAASCGHAASAQTEPALFETIALEQAGDGGVHTWRIPALAVAGDGSLIAAFDARNDDAGDLPGNIDIVVRRSHDLGRSWTPATRVADYDNGEGAGDPSLLVDHSRNRVFLFFAYGGPGVGFFRSSDERSPDSRSAQHPYLLWSDDNGASWQGPRNLIAEIKPVGAHGLFATSGHGIQLSDRSAHPGRLLQPYVWIDGQRRLHAANAISDDHGASWRMGTDIGIGLDENKAVELDDGRVLQNIRAYDKRTHHRLLAYSDDGGERYAAAQPEPNLPDPRNNADIIRAHPDAAPGSREARMLLFVNTAHPRDRRDLTVRLSCDSGQSWPVAKLLHAGPAMYAALARLPDGSYGVLYENGEAAGMTFARFNLAWLGDCTS
jgi:sialidase-1